MKFGRNNVCRAVLSIAILAANIAVFHVSSLSCRADDSAQKMETIDNDTIIQLQGLNFGDNVIIAKIKTSKCVFDLSVGALKRLKDAKVSDAVIQAMLATASPAPVPVAAPVSAPVAGNFKALPTGDVNDPNTRHSAGFWLYDETSKTMTQLNVEAFRIWAGGGPWGAATHAVLTGFNSKTTVASHRPTFYLYTGDGGGDFGSLANITPDQIPMAKLDQKAKTQERLLVIGSAAAFSGYNSGIPKKNQVESESVKVTDGVFKVTPSKDLVDGEYAFFYGFADGRLGGAGGRMFTFGVHTK